MVQTWVTYLMVPTSDIPMALRCSMNDSRNCAFGREARRLLTYSILFLQSCMSSLTPALLKRGGF
ncbi:MAG: hypothetical protein H5T34_00380 [Candidatus Methanomethyliales bacterium]|nr:hypothetical protein [Candidatus Methanomethylicales archaeon]